MTSDQHEPAQPAEDAGEAMKRRLRDDLRDAMRARAAMETAVLRVLVAAFDNAEAAPVGDTHARYQVRMFGDRSAEVPRLRLSESEVRRVLAQEVAARTEAAAELERLGRRVEAAALRAEADIVARY